MSKINRGKGKLYDNDDTNFICDTRYEITVDYDSLDRPKYSGALFEIEGANITELQEKEFVLRLKDGTPLEIETLGLSFLLKSFRLEFIIQGKINL